VGLDILFIGNILQTGFVSRNRAYTSLVLFLLQVTWHISALLSFNQT